METIDVKIRGNGFYKSDDDFTLSLSNDGDEYWFTLFGRKDIGYHPDDDRVQFDFNTMTREEIEEIHTALGLILDSSNK